MLKVLLVDDETITLKGLQYILTKYHPEYEIIGAIKNPEEALKVLQTSAVNVVITDVKMPDINGAELTKLVHGLYPETFVIILSGFSDFEYVRQCMKNGAYDYLLKPCKYQDLFDILQKIEAQIIEKDKKLQQDMHKKYFKKILLGEERIPEKWSIYDTMQIIVVSISGSKYTVVLGYKELIRRKFDKMEDNGEIDIEEVDGRIIVIFNKPLDILTIKKIFYSSEMEPRNGEVVSLYIAYCNFTYSNGSLAKAYSNCGQMIEYMEFNELSTILGIGKYNEYMEQQKQHTLDNYFSSNLFIKYILQGQVKKAQMYIFSIYSRLINSDAYMDPISMKQQVLEGVMSIEHVLGENGINIEQIIGRKIDYINDIKKLGTYRLVLDWLKDYFTAVIMGAQNERDIPYYICEAKSFLEKHYFGNISLKTIADEVHLNPLYFSTQFKKYVGVSFTEYLNQIRIRKAKELLQQKDLKVYQVADMVGFRDATYFNTVFKNMEKITPKEYQRFV